MEEGEILICTCCGSGVPNTPEGNVSFGEEPYPHDEGYGLCKECGGDSSIKAAPGETITVEQLKKRMGWAKCTFFEARFDIVRKNLNEANRQKWDAFSYARKCLFVAQLVREGKMI